MHPQHWDHAFLAAAYAHLGKQHEAHLAAAEVLHLLPAFSAASFVKSAVYLNPADQERLLSGLRKAGLPE
jgi:adenylate cyclase